MAMLRWCNVVARRVLVREQCALFTTSSLSSVLARSSGIGDPILCGRGDKKMKKGKRFKGSFGNAWQKKKKMIERIKNKVEFPRSTPWPEALPSKHI